MRYRVLEPFKVKIPKEEMELQPGQVITLPHDKTLTLLNERKISPIEKVAYRIYSELLGCCLWVVETDHDLHSLRSQGISEAIYTAEEIQKLRRLNKDSLKEIHKIKQVFPESIVDEIKGLC
jgi:hypothetical protein